MLTYGAITGNLIISIILNGYLAAYACRRRRNKAGAMPYIGLILSVMAYSVGYTFEIAGSTPEELGFWLRVEYLGVSFLPALWLIFVWEYVGDERFLTRRRIWALFAIPMITLILHFTNGWHHLFYQEIHLKKVGPFSVAVLEKGPWYWVQIAYLYFSLVYGNLLLWREYRRAPALYKGQTVCMMLGSLLPLTGDLIYLTGNSPGGIDLGPFMIAFTTPLYAWGLFRFQMLNLVPIARDKVFEGIRDGVIVLDEQNRLADFNPAAGAILPELSKDAIGKPINRAVSHQEFAKQLAAGCSEFEIQIIMENEKQYYQSRISPIVNRRGILIGKTIIISNVTDRVLLLEKLNNLAMIDEATQLYNRRKFREESLEKLAQARREGRPVAAMIMDVDHFKQVNDHYGHGAGDRVLYAIAQRCRENLTPGALLGRYGGEEFTVYLAGASPAEAFDAAERLRLAIAVAPVEWEGRSIQITASFGVAAVKNAAGIHLDQLLQAADEALYKAKDAGRNCTVLNEVE